MSTPMQGQRGTSSSLSAGFEFEHGSSSSSAAVDQQLCWNNMLNQADSRVVDYIPPPSNNITFLTSIGHELPNLANWGPGGPSSSDMHPEMGNERKTEHSWPASVSSYGGPGPLLEDRRYEQPGSVRTVDNVSMNPLVIHSSSSSSMPPNLNVPTGFVGHGSESSPLLECPNLYKPSRSGAQWLPAGNSSDPFTVASSSGTGNFGEDNDVRPGSLLDGRRIPCKRKSFEGHIGQSSNVGSSSYSQNLETNASPNLLIGRNYDGTTVSSSFPEQADPRSGLGLRGAGSRSLPDLSVAGSTENMQRNFRVRGNALGQNMPNPPISYSAGTGNGVFNPGFMSNQPSSRLLTIDPSLDLRPITVASDANGQHQTSVPPVPTLPPSGPSIRWNRALVSRASGSSSAVLSGNRDAGSHDESNSSSNGRNILEHSMFVPSSDLGNSVPNPSVRRSAGGSSGIPLNTASSSRGSASSSRQSSHGHWAPHYNRHPQYPRRLSEYVRRSLMSSMGSEPEGQSSYAAVGSGPPASSQDILLSSRSGYQGQAIPSRSTIWTERQGDGAVGFPYPMRSLAAASEGRRRLVSEVRNVLDLMRRSEGLRIEDYMLLEQSVFFGMADIHDRHRDMRLDVDNMTYEELLALEEHIGNVNTGLNEEIISTRMKQRKCAIPVDSDNEVEPCCICQEEYNTGDDLGTLECGHDFHRDCIKQWLMHKNLCPICKTTGLNT
ncbi:probable E3 ubiquitin-protein ligase RHG1A [Rhodamnia argentea]|uniref:RING-type E3 ubiquitin transferase n=1 Tax=Rhodamnia argentea TaxID=178133 RepID=A0A8B8PZ06_9MYRT|nr:probable E3 ubiquitin-protein ligase RHG1A [Rhodamnia argentea]XP_048129927.1 probable E3 ubiquitin-protein ligase RHG1A [Rhodamnia argentea]